MPKKGKDGYYHSKVTPAKGVKPVYFRARTLREFNQERQRIIEEYRTGRQGRDMSFVDLAEEWFRVVKSPRLRPNSLQSQRSILKVHILSFFPPQQLARAIRYKNLQSCVDHMQGMARDTIAHVISMLKGICRYAVSEGAMAADYASALCFPVTAAPAPRSALTADQAAALRAADAPQPLRVALSLLYYCGLRTGEALGLQWADVDFKSRRLHVLRQLNRRTRSIAETKTASSVRWVDMPEELVAFLLPLRSLPALYVASGAADPLPFSQFQYAYVRLMISLGYAHLNECAAKKAAQCEKAGKAFKPSGNIVTYYTCDFTPHTLRHNYATALYRAEIDPAMAMKLLGHTSYDTTLEVYTDIKNMLDDAVTLDDHLLHAVQKVAEKLQTKRTGTV